MTVPKLQSLPLRQILESPWNPRRTFDPKKQANLEASIAAHGQLEPLLGRPAGSSTAKIELAAGHRRRRALEKVGVKEALIIVRPMTDAEFIEILTIDNEEREDVHPLEQAEGYRLLITKAGYDVAKIAERIQRSHEFVQDRIRLLELTPALKEHFLKSHFGIGHAIELAKLSPGQQTTAAACPGSAATGGGLWRNVSGTLDADGSVFGLQAVTVEELKHFIATNIRFREDKVTVEELFPETAIALENAEQTGTRVLSISYDDYLRPRAKDQKERTFTARFWKRADGLEGSKACDYATVAIVRAGEHRGEAFGVCVRRDKCVIHWKADVARAKGREAGKKKRTRAAAGGDTKAQAKVERDKQKELEAARAQRRDLAIAAHVVTAIQDSFEGLVATAPIDKCIAYLAWEAKSGDFNLYHKHAKPLAAAKTADEFVRVMVDELLGSLVENVDAEALAQGDRWYLEGLALFGIDLKALKKEWAAKVDAGPTCKYCGCTELNPCEGGCTWESKTPSVCNALACVTKRNIDEQKGGK